jgi:Skp family chaperone for outer membrane proteins
MKSLFRAGSIGLILVVLAFAGGSAADSKPATPGTRIALVNLTYVFKNYKKHIAVTAELREHARQYEKRASELSAHLAILGRELEPPVPTPEKKERVEQEMRSLQRQLEDVKVEARAVLEKKQNKVLVEVFREIQQTTERYAKDHNIDLVLQYNEDVEYDGPLSSAPANILRKVQSNGCLPLYAAPGLDITKEIVAILNEKDR